MSYCELLFLRYQVILPNSWGFLQKWRSTHKFQCQNHHFWMFFFFPGLPFERSIRPAGPSTCCHQAGGLDRTSHRSRGAEFRELVRGWRGWRGWKWKVYSGLLWSLPLNWTPIESDIWYIWYIYDIMGKKCGKANNQSSPIEAYCRVYLYLGWWLMTAKWLITVMFFFFNTYV